MSETYLGTLCKRNHNYNKSGKSLRYSSNNSCVECQHLLKTSKIYAKKSSKYNKKYYIENKENILKNNKEYVEKNKEKINAHKETYKSKHPEKVKLTQKTYRKNNKDKIKEIQQAYRINNQGKVNNRAKIYRRENRSRLLTNRRKYYRNVLCEDINYKINSSVRAGINASLSGRKNGRHWEDLVGYTLDELKKHIEKQFVDDMTWDNYGQWHLDHIVPSSLFEFESHEDLAFKECWNLHNLQPLWAFDNISKSNRFIG